MKFSNLQKKVLFVLVLILAVMPTITVAQSFVPLVGLPGLEDPSNLSFNDYLNALLRIAIIAGALVAVVKLILAGTQYVLSGIITEKTDARRDIYSAIIGLLIIILAVTILRTINSDLVNLGVLPNAPSFDNQTSTGGTFTGTADDFKAEAFKRACLDNPEENCDIESCLEEGAFEIPIIGTTVNGTLCEAVCNFRGGKIVNAISGISSGSCLFPKDSATVVRTQKEIASDLLRDALPDPSIVSEDDLVVACQISIGRSQCQRAIESCTRGYALPDRAIGTAEQSLTKDGKARVIICSPR